MPDETGIRPAQETDISRMVALSDFKRTEYEGFAPTFWRKASDGAEKQVTYFESLLDQPHIVALVWEESRQIQGFIIASITTAPAVYDPGSAVTVVDDFVVATADRWATAGVALLSAARQKAREQGADLSIVVCGHLDEPKRSMLRSCGYVIASEWYVNPP